MRTTVLLALPLVLLGACANNYRPVIDPATSNAPPGRYQYDLAECQTLADQVPVANEVGANALGGAAVGAVAGGIIGSFSGNFGKGVAAGAGVGAAGGAARAAIKTDQEKRNIVQNCMRNRGYSVLN